MRPWEWPSQPWSRIHIDYAGPLQGKMFLVVVNAYSKWIEVSIVNSATSISTIQKLRAICLPPMVYPKLLFLTMVVYSPAANFSNL